MMIISWIWKIILRIAAKLLYSVQYPSDLLYYTDIVISINISSVVNTISIEMYFIVGVYIIICTYYSQWRQISTT
jgi:hypothetical protein